MRTVRVVPLLLAFAAGLHLAVLPSHLEEGAAVGGFFLLVAVAQLGAAVLVHRGTSPGMRAVIAAGNLGVVAVWVGSRTVGLGLVGQGGGPEPVALLDLLSVVAELAAIAGLYLLSSAARPARSSRLAGLPALAVVALLASGVGLSLVPAAHGDAGTHPEPAPAADAPTTSHH